MTRSLVRDLVLFSLAVISGGCHATAWESMPTVDEPWVGPAQRVQLQRQFVAIFISGGTRLRWQSNRGTYTPVYMAKVVDDYLRSLHIRAFSLPPSYRSDPEWRAYFEKWRKTGDADVELPVLADKRAYLVCVHPVIAILADQMTDYEHPSFSNGDAYGYTPGSLGTDASLNDLVDFADNPPDVGLYRVFLPWGVVAATKFKATGKLEWFSPAWTQPPQPLRFGASYSAHLSVPWGTLLVRRNGETVTVEAVSH